MKQTDSNTTVQPCRDLLILCTFSSTHCYKQYFEIDFYLFLRNTHVCTCAFFLLRPLLIQQLSNRKYKSIQKHRREERKDCSISRCVSRLYQVKTSIRMATKTSISHIQKHTWLYEMFFFSVGKFAWFSLDNANTNNLKALK